MTLIVCGAVLFLAWSNGSNDNFKGVATIYGSKSAGYRTSLGWATVTTLGGSLLALALAAALVQAFSARGLVPDALAASPAFLGAAALGAGATVLLATRLGLPVSTTHALTGALVGAGFSSGAAVSLGVLGKGFVLPLLLSPVLAMLLTVVLYPIARASRSRLGVTRESCVCVGEDYVPIAQLTRAGAAALSEEVRLKIKTGQGCADRYTGRFVGLSAQTVLDGAHFLSAGAVSFARGLNDTPKIFALLLAAHALGAQVGLASVAAAMAIGGLLGARRVAETMSNQIVTLNAGQGFVANLATAGLVIAASRYGLPVSTTHVSTGGLFGIAMVNGTARRKTIAAILVAWLTTLPLAAALGAATYLALR